MNTQDAANRLLSTTPAKCCDWGRLHILHLRGRRKNDDIGALYNLGWYVSQPGKGYPGLARVTWCFDCGEDFQADYEYCEGCGRPVDMKDSDTYLKWVHDAEGCHLCPGCQGPAEKEKSA